ncbi:MAG: chemotaxis protein CheA [Phenylobacterium sp.]|uniref:chemotaxis protein CheA n=1 Tax=Phenylobacterium sp. TaxID=1871053 RepID=UPI001A4E510D|nr:chemotaxis protein CheA [Phenylobacterium sp.]MBL8774017.1 chemotaxis protein CheA [Phenylobacterium sp.]
MDEMEAIRATFFAECEDLLGDLEAGLLALKAGAVDEDTVNAVFRAVHSVKGGAGAFSLEALVGFSHAFETSLDELRKGRLSPGAEVVAVLLRASDVLADLVSAARDDRALPQEFGAEVVHELEGLLTVQDSVAPSPAFTAPPAEAPAPGAPSFAFTPVNIAFEAEAPPCAWIVCFRPLDGMYAAANDEMLLLRELERLGAAEVTADVSGLPDLSELEPERPRLAWRVRLTGDDLSEARIREVFEFVGDDCDVTVAQEAAPETVPEPLADAGPDDAVAEVLARIAAETAPPEQAGPPAAPEEPAATAPAPAAALAAQGGERRDVQATIRVDLDRVDRLINLVGELVINQAMLGQRVVEAGLAKSSTVAVGLDDLEQLTREIQDSVMAIRAQPVKSVFQRMPRLVREVAAATRKQVRLVTEGEGTEVDKTVIERLSDPITHMIRNAIDHGLESPADRVAAGKPAEGVVRLSAMHRSGRIVIEVADDGRGINRDRVRDIAVERGIVDRDATLTDEEVDNLIFAPGFSTAPAVSDISGRGVGMDVVKRSIQALGGRISISSRPGEGSTFTLSLPLTLAVLDGMVVTIGDHTLVIPISVIVETLRPRAADVRPFGSSRVLTVRGAAIPFVDVATAFNWRRASTEAAAGVTLLVESEVGGLIALGVDAIQGQRQVVIKSLEQNFRQVDGIAAATILGDGRVALILDVDGIVAARRRGQPAVAPEPFLQAS